jgi:hypothetical protein
MSQPQEPDLPQKGQFLVYRAEDGQMKIDVRLEGETAWLTQSPMAELFQTTPQNITLHLQAIYAEGELTEAATCKDYLQVRTEGTRQVQRALRHYNLDAIISVGYRVKSAVATRFRIWATQKLREFIVKGFVLDDERLKNHDQPFDYFDELLYEAPTARCHHSLGRRPRLPDTNHSRAESPLHSHATILEPHHRSRRF